MTTLEDGWRHSEAGGGGGTQHCDNVPGPPAAGSFEDPETFAPVPPLPEEARWYRFRGAAGDQMPGEAPPSEGACGTGVPGWLQSDHPDLGAPPADGTVCFRYARVPCFWSVPVSMCTCSFDGGASVVRMYKLPRPPNPANRCLGYCGQARQPDEIETSPVDAQRRRLQAYGYAGGEAAYAPLAPSAPADSEAPADAEAPASANEVPISPDGGSPDGDGVEGGSLGGGALSSPGAPYTLPPSAPSVSNGLAAPASAEWSLVGGLAPGRGTMLGDEGHGAAVLEVASESRLLARTPALPVGLVQIQVSVSGAEWLARESADFGDAYVFETLPFEVYSPPRLYRIWPTAGPVAGGTSVTVIGEGLDVIPGTEGVACRFGGVMGAATFKNDTHVLCVTPSSSGRAGPQPFALTLNGAREFTTGEGAAATFIYYQLRVLSVYPISSYLEGGLNVTLEGVGFDALGGLVRDAARRPYDPRCRFYGGAHGWTPVLRLNATHASCSVPAAPAGERESVDLALALNGVDYEGAVPFLYFPTPLLHSVFPHGGPLVGGTHITISGSGLDPLDSQGDYVAQWATSASSSSQYSDSVGAAHQALGPPDAQSCGGLNGNSWMAAVGVPVENLLEVTFGVEVRPWRWTVHMSNKPEALVKLELVDTVGKHHDLGYNATAPQTPLACSCTGAAADGCTVAISGEIPSGTFPTASGLRLHTLADGWEAVDAVLLEGYAPDERCKLGGAFTSILRHTDDSVVCTTPALAAARGDGTGSDGSVMSGVPISSAGAVLAHATRAAEADEALADALESGLPAAVSAAARLRAAELGHLLETESGGAALAGDADALALAASAGLGAAAAHQMGGESAAEQWRVELSVNGRDGYVERLNVADDFVGFTFYPPPVPERIVPELVSATGGTSVTIFAAGVDIFGSLSTTKCRFGGGENASEVVSEVFATHKGAAHVVCVVPAAAAGNEFGSAQVSLALNAWDFQRMGEVQYFASGRPTQLKPTGGPAGGGTLLTILGRGFANVAPASQAGAQDETAANLAAKIAAVSAPPSTPATVVGLRQGKTVLAPVPLCRFAFVPPEGDEPYITGQGAATAYVGGSDGSGAPYVDPWYMDVPAVSWSEDEMGCVVPKRPIDYSADMGPLQVSVSLDGGTSFASNTLPFELYDVRIRSLYPRGGPTEGGSVVVYGDGLGSFGADGGVRCRFGAAIVRALSRDEQSVRCVVPSICGHHLSAAALGGAPESEADCVSGDPSLTAPLVDDGDGVAWAAFPPVRVAVSFNGQDFHESPQHYFIYEQPELHALSPVGGALGGGGPTEVTLSGSGFSALVRILSGEGEEPDGTLLWCRFGEHPPRPALAFNDTLATCQLPSATGADAMRLAVSLNGGVDWYDRASDPSVDDDSPAAARHPEAPQRSLSFAFYEEPTLVSIRPQAAHSAGGVRITLIGARFDAFGEVSEAFCRFDETLVPAVSKTASEVVCEAPPTARVCHASRSPNANTSSRCDYTQSQHVSVSVDEGVSFVTARESVPGINTLPLTLTRYEAAAWSIEPTSGPIRGGFPVRIRGYGLRSLEPAAPGAPLVLSLAAGGDGSDEGAGAARCAFGSIEVRPFLMSDRWVECEAPPAWALLAGLPDGALENLNISTVAVRFSLQDRHYLLPPDEPTPPLRLHYFADPLLRALSPAGGPVDGGTRVTIHGDFPAPVLLELVRCRFGERALAAAAASAHEVVCLSPPYAPPSGRRHQGVEVQLVFGSGDDWRRGTEAPLRFTYYGYAAISYAPRGGPIDGGTLLAVRGSGFTLHGNVSGVRARLRQPGYGGRVVELGDAIGLQPGAVEFTTPAVDAAIYGLELRMTLNALDGYDGDYEPSVAAAARPFSFYAPPSTSSISPRAGPLGGGTLVELRGVGYADFGEVPDPSELHLTAASNSSSGYVTNGIHRRDLSLLRGTSYSFRVEAVGHPLVISTNQSNEGELGEADGVFNSRVERGVLTFTPTARLPSLLYYRSASVDWRGGLSHGHRQRIRLVAPSGACALEFGRARLPPLLRNATAVGVHVPTPAIGEPSGDVLVRLSLNGQQFHPTMPFFRYDPPVVSSFSPAYGPTAGGALLLLRGHNLRLLQGWYEPLVWLGGVPASVTGVSEAADEIEATMPPLAIGEHEVSISLNGLPSDAQLTGAVVRIVKMPSREDGASLLRPSMGPTRGGTIVRFPAGELSDELSLCCAFGTPPTGCIAAELLRPQGADPFVECTSPPASTAGALSFHLSLDGGANYLQLDVYTMYTVSINGLQPSLGPAAGGTVLSLDASGLSNLTLQDDPAPLCGFRQSAMHGAGYAANESVLEPTGATVDIDGAHAGSVPVSCASPRCDCALDETPCVLSVSLAPNGVDFDFDNGLSFLCHPRLSVDAIEPLGGPRAGGTAVSVSGGPFPTELAAMAPDITASVACYFGEYAVNATIQSASSLLCAPSPALAAVGRVASTAQLVRISLNDVDLAPSLERAPLFYFYDEPYLQRLAPRSGPLRGGTALTLSGMRLGGGGWARAEETAVIELALRDAAEGAASQRLRVTRIERGGLSLATAPTDSPLDASALLESADAGGMSALAASCAVSCVWDVALALNAQQPSGLSTFQSSQLPPLHFAFYNETMIEIIRIEPPSGPIHGGTAVTIHGASLVPNGSVPSEARCAFGALTVPVLDSDPDGAWITCAPTLPSVERGHARISIAPNGVDFETGPANVSFLLYDDPIIERLTPAGGPSDGGTAVLVRGLHMESDAAHMNASRALCRFGRGDPSKAVVSMSKGAVECAPSPPAALAPSNDAENRWLQLALNGQQFAPLADVPSAAFRYYEQPSLLAIHPKAGPVGGGTIVTLTGDGLGRFGQLGYHAHGGVNDGMPLCFFGGPCFDEAGIHRGPQCSLPVAVALNLSAEPRAVAATALAPSRLLCRAPPLSGPLPQLTSVSRGRTSVRVALALNGQNFAHELAPLFSYVSGVLVGAVEPLMGPPAGRVQIRISGDNFDLYGGGGAGGGGGDARCRFVRWRPLVSSAALGKSHTLTGALETAVSHQDDSSALCPTPRLPAGVVEVELSLNGIDYVARVPPLTHTLACEQLSSLSACVADASCGFCEDRLPEAHIDWERFGHVQTRVGCLPCDASGCVAGPREGICRLWAFETLLLEPPRDGVEAAGLSLANVSLTLASPNGPNGTATLTPPPILATSAQGALAPGAARYYRVRPPHRSVAIMSVAAVAHGNARLYASRGHAPNASDGGFELVSARASSPLSLVIEQTEQHCQNVSGDLTADVHADASAHAHCDEWVIGLIGGTYLPARDHGLTPQATAAHYELSVRFEPRVVDFGCDECAGDCHACGWRALHSARFVQDSETSRRVARLTEAGAADAMGALWLQQPQHLDGGFVARFSFRVSAPSHCAAPLATFGTNATAQLPAGVDFVPAGDDSLTLSHFPIDHPSLPFDPIPPPEGVPAHLEPLLGYSTCPTAAHGHLLQLPGSGVHAALEPNLPADRAGCPSESGGGVGGEGLAFVVQWEGVDAAGCAGVGVGYAAAPGCERRIRHSLAVQFDVQRRVHVLREASCAEHDPFTLECLPGAETVRERLAHDRQNAVGVFVSGKNAIGDQLGLALLGYQDGIRFDDGRAHQAEVSYTPAGNTPAGNTPAGNTPAGNTPAAHPLNQTDGIPQGVLKVRLGGSKRVALSVPIALGTLRPNSNAATVGFTASTGLASERHDILSFSLCQRVGCAAI